MPGPLRKADFVVEAIPERLELKQRFFREAAEQVRDGVVLASNTSGLPITELGRSTPHPHRVVAGLDIYHAVASYLNKHLSARTDVSLLILRKVEHGELGLKTGRGLFAYTTGEIPELTWRRARALIAVRKALDEDGRP